MRCGAVQRGCRDFLLLGQGFAGVRDWCGAVSGCTVARSGPCHFGTRLAKPDPKRGCRDSCASSHHWLLFGVELGFDCCLPRTKLALLQRLNRKQKKDCCFFLIKRSGDLTFHTQKKCQQRSTISMSHPRSKSSAYSSRGLATVVWIQRRCVLPYLALQLVHVVGGKSHQHLRRVIPQQPQCLGKSHVVR